MVELALPILGLDLSLHFVQPVQLVLDNAERRRLVQHPVSDVAAGLDCVVHSQSRISCVVIRHSRLGPLLADLALRSGVVALNFEPRHLALRAGLAKQPRGRALALGLGAILSPVHGTDCIGLVDRGKHVDGPDLDADFRVALLQLVIDVLLLHVLKLSVDAFLLLQF